VTAAGHGIDLAGRVAIVTGGATGLGRGAAQALVAAGAKVVIIGRRKDVLERTSAEMGCESAVCDITDRGQVFPAFAAISERHGRLDILVNAAGLNLRGDSFDFDDRDWDKVHTVNCRGSFITSVEAARIMRGAGAGKIVNYCSYCSANGLPRSVAYSSSKGGVRQMTKSLAIEFAPLGIQVNGIEPGWFRTDMTEKLFEDEAWVDRTHARIPMGRVGSVDDLSGALLFLASPMSDYVTGIMVPVDGGAQAV
jgi:NAD(P)-dependent dehydrogenase (short-subunit alcohol dehydrogenase family)